MEWVLVAEYSTEVEANIAQGMLESEGINSRVTCDNLGGLIFGFSSTGPIAKVFVLARDKDVALKIINK